MEGVVTRAVFVRALAGVTAMALISLLVQANGLVGAEGILPFTDFLDRVWTHLGRDAYLQVPTLLWLWPTDFGLYLLFALGLALCAALLWGTGADGVVLLALWAVYLSLCSVFQVFLNFQWDSLMVELLFVGALWCQFLPGARRPPPIWARWLTYWVVFKLFFFGGLVKLTSGDPTWRDGTAMTYHYWTQPLPNPVSWYADRLPDAFQAFSQWAMFAIELVLPFGIAAGVQGRRVVVGPLLLLLFLLAFTGNYGFFQLLGAVACLALVDDELWRRVLPAAVQERIVEPTEPARHLAAPVAGLLFLTSLLFAWGYRDLPEWGQTWAGAAHPYRTANSYGLFAVMTTERPVVVFETSTDGRTWEPLWLPQQTGPTDRMPAQVAPHMPRLDWQMWFAALGSCQRNPWVFLTQRRLVEGSPAVWGLFGQDVPAELPRFVRTTRWDYRFAEPGEDGWWVREGGGPYCPVTSAER